tara:strand:+ start:9885 stop:10469 length:585 start_codon:yes stop_codon:yes gene_type:complete
MSEIERRIFAVEGMKVERRDGKPTIIRGHAAVFNSLSEDLGGFREQVLPGAFATAVKTDDVRALFNHDPNFILGRNRSGTLRLIEDARGLAFEIDAPETQTIMDLVIAPIERGDVSQMSFAFSPRPGGADWAKDDAGQVIRSLKNVRLYDVSPVVYPAYAQTDVAVRELRSFLAAAAPSVPSNLLKALQQQADS